MSESAHGQRQGGGRRSAKWSTLRNAFLSAVESSKAGDGGRREACSTTSTGTGTSTTDPPRFEGFTLFPRCAGARRDSMIQQDVRWLPMCSSGGRRGGSKERATTSYTHTNSVERVREREMKSCRKQEVGSPTTTYGVGVVQGRVAVHIGNRCMGMPVKLLHRDKEHGDPGKDENHLEGVVKCRSCCGYERPSPFCPSSVYHALLLLRGNVYCGTHIRLRYNYASFSPCSTATLPVVIRADTKKGRHRFQRHRLQQLNRRPAGGLS